jgi:hypothetical protein
MGWMCSMHMSDEKCIQYFSCQTWRVQDIGINWTSVKTKLGKEQNVTMWTEFT